jgi:hypothetical protein
MVDVKESTSRFAKGSSVTLYSGRIMPTDDEDASRFSVATLTSTVVARVLACMVKLNRAC